MSVQVRTAVDHEGQRWVEIVIDGVIYRTSAPNLQVALGLAHSATVTLGRSMSDEDKLRGYRGRPPLRRP